MDLKGKRILVTYGPTWVAIDDTRVISNCSSGEMGGLITDHLLAAGARVTALVGPGVDAPQARRGLRVRTFRFFDELARLLDAELGCAYDVVIHAAAVSDYAVRRRIRGKIESGRERLLIDLIPTPKLISRIKKRIPGVVLVAFKLESFTDERRFRTEAVRSVAAYGSDFVVANSLTGGYRGWIFDRDGRRLAKARSRREMSRRVIEQLIAYNR